MCRSSIFACSRKALRREARKIRIMTMKLSLLVVSPVCVVLFLTPTCFSAEAGPSLSLAALGDTISARRSLATGANSADIGASAAGTEEGRIEKKHKPSKSTKGKSLKKGSTSSKSGKGGKGGKGSYDTDNLLPTSSAPTCHECDDMEVYQSSSSFSLYYQDSKSEPTSTDSLIEVFLSVGITLVVLALAWLLLAVFACLKAQKDPCTNAINYEQQARDAKLSDADLTVACDEDDEDWRGLE